MQKNNVMCLLLSVFVFLLLRMHCNIVSNHTWSYTPEGTAIPRVRHRGQSFGVACHTSWGQSAVWPSVISDGDGSSSVTDFFFFFMEVPWKT